MTKPPNVADVVIIGGGVMGTSTVYHLVQKGCTDVALLEKAEFFGTGATGQNAGGIRHQFSTSVNIELSKHSIVMLERFPEELDQEIDLNFCGYLFLLDNEDDLITFRHNVELQHKHGVETQLLDVDDVAELAPQVNVKDIIGGTFYRRDGLADPAGVVQGYVKNARRLGATLARLRERRRQRAALARLDARLLRDIGLSPSQARREAAKPIWRQ